jgi:hypothetical protein
MHPKVPARIMQVLKRSKITVDSQGVFMNARFVLSALLCIALMATSFSVPAQKRSGVVAFATEYLVGKAIDGIWDVATGKVDYDEIQARLRRLEKLFGAASAPITELRQSISRSTTRGEYQKAVDAVLRGLAASETKNADAFSNVYIGSVGKLKAAFSLTWKQDGNVSGVYLYPTRDMNQIYELRGTNQTAGVLELQEFTDGRLSATIALRKEVTPAWIIWRGKMSNTDGRKLEVSFQREL